MKIDSTEQIRLLKEETVRIFGKSLDSPTDYDALAAEILEKTGKSISSTTLKRVFGYIKNGNAPTGATLGLLARYCGDGRTGAQDTEQGPEQTGRQEGAEHGR